jgi:hypothetical protein
MGIASRTSEPMAPLESNDRDDEGEICCLCGARFWPEIDRGFACSPEDYLCFACAERCGGIFDAREDRWVVAPDVSGLKDERRPKP